MDDDNFPSAVAVRMSIFFAGTPVGGPACVANSISAIQRLKPDDLFQIAQLAFGAPYLQRVSAAAPVPGHSNAGGVVSAIFKPPQPVNNHRNNALLAYITDDSTHRVPTRTNALTLG